MHEELDQLHRHRQHTRTDDERLREALIQQHERLVKAIAARFAGQGETIEDLVQVGTIGLLRALERYDPEQGVRFSTYATSTILGEIKRHFRDKSCLIKVPRPLQELNAQAARAAQLMTHPLGRSPTPAEVAERLGVSEEQILEALEAGEATSVQSLDAGAGPTEGAATWSLWEAVGHTDPGLREFEAYGDLRAALAKLAAPEQEVIRLRFFEELSQAAIARKLGVSQMQVSRLQQRALKRLRERLTGDPFSGDGRCYGCRPSP